MDRWDEAVETRAVTARIRPLVADQRQGQELPCAVALSRLVLCCGTVWLGEITRAIRLHRYCPGYLGTDYGVYPPPTLTQTAKATTTYQQLTALSKHQILIHFARASSRTSSKPTGKIWTGRDCNMPKGGMRRCLSCLMR